MTKQQQYIIGGVVLFLIGMFFLRFELPAISVAAEPLFKFGEFKITNSLFTSAIATILILIVTLIGTRNMQLVPSGLQNILEFIVEGLYNLTENICGPEWVKKFYLIPITIFFYVLVSNLLGLLPFVPAIGLCEAVHHGDDHAEDTHAKEHPEDSGGIFSFRLGSTCGDDEHLVPLIRSPSADLNNSLMLGLFSQVLAQIFGFAALGFGGYMAKFFVFGGIPAAFQPDAEGNKPSFGQSIGKLAMALIDAAVGLLELLSEFVKVIAYTFRLFGNIFAGEVMLIVLTFLVPIGLTVPFYAFELFVALIQAFVFYVLSVAFYTVAVTPAHHGDEAH